MLLHRLPRSSSADVQMLCLLICDQLFLPVCLPPSPSGSQKRNHICQAERNSHNWPDVCNFLLLVLSRGLLQRLVFFVNVVYIVGNNETACPIRVHGQRAPWHTGSSDCEAVATRCLIAIVSQAFNAGADQSNTHGNLLAAWKFPVAAYDHGLLFLCPSGPLTSWCFQLRIILGPVDWQIIGLRILDSLSCWAVDEPYRRRMTSSLWNMEEEKGLECVESSDLLWVYDLQACLHNVKKMEGQAETMSENWSI